MKLPKGVLEAAFKHAEQEQDRESCGLVVKVNKRLKYWPCKNIATRNQDFHIAHDDIVDAELAGEIVMIVHSHPMTSPQPTWADLDYIEHTQKPWLIVNWRTHTHTITKPTGWITPLEGRTFVPGIHDCYGLIRDYYKQVRQIKLPNFPRDDEWWLKGQNLFVENFEKAGFVRVYEAPIEHDVLLMQIGSSVPNHGVVYLGDRMFLHHCTNHLSGKGHWSGAWERCTTHVLRYRGA